MGAENEAYVKEETAVRKDTRINIVSPWDILYYIPPFVEHSRPNSPSSSCHCYDVCNVDSRFLILDPNGCVGAIPTDQEEAKPMISQKNERTRSISLLGYHHRENERVQVTLEGAPLQPNRQTRRSREKQVEVRGFSSRWLELMNECLFYVESCNEGGHDPRLEEVRNFMLKEYGLRYETTSSILRDLDRIGIIKALDNRIFLVKNLRSGRK